MYSFKLEYGLYAFEAQENSQPPWLTDKVKIES